MGVPYPIDGIECDGDYNPFGGDGDLQRTDVPGTTQELYGALLLGLGTLSQRLGRMRQRSESTAGPKRRKVNDKTTWTWGKGATCR